MADHEPLMSIATCDLVHLRAHDASTPVIGHWIEPCDNKRPWVKRCELSLAATALANKKAHPDCWLRNCGIPEYGWIAIYGLRLIFLFCPSLTRGSIIATQKQVAVQKQFAWLNWRKKMLTDYLERLQ